MQGCGLLTGRATDIDVASRADISVIIASEVKAAMKRHPGLKASIAAPDFSEGVLEPSDTTEMPSGGASLTESSEGVVILDRERWDDSKEVRIIL